MRAIAVAALLLVGCGYVGQGGVRRVTSPSDEWWFSTHCRHERECRKDAKDICPEGYTPTPTGKEEKGEFLFKCHGKADW